MNFRPWSLACFACLGISSIACGSSGSADETLPDTSDAGSDASDGATTDSPAEDAAPDAVKDSAPDVIVEAEASVPDTCAPPPSCDAPLPDFGDARGFYHASSTVTAALGSPRHRGRDLYLLEGQQQWVLGKFAYGAFDDDIRDEAVDVYLLRDCGSSAPWEALGTTRTTEDGDHATVEGVEDTGGRVYLDLADTGAAPLGIGRHRLVLVVGGDLTWTDQYIEVLPPEAKIVVTDIDGTLTTSEYASLTDVIGLPPAEAHPGAADVMNAFASRGYHIFYMTARAEWMMPITREWLPLRGFPPGNVHTTLSGLGATGDAAVTYKTDELAALKAKTGITPSYGFGNKDSDVQAYVNAGIDPAHCYYFDLGGDPQGGNDFPDYTALVPMAESAPLACQ